MNMNTMPLEAETRILIDRNLEHLGWKLSGKDQNRRKLDTPSDLSKYEEYRKLDKDQMADMLKVGFEKIPLDKVRRNANILVGSRYRISSVHSNYETVNFSDIATLTRGVTYKKQQQTTFRTSNVILPADNITLQGQLIVEKSHMRA